MITSDRSNGPETHVAPAAIGCLGDRSGTHRVRVLLLAGEYPPDVGGIGTFAINAARALRLAGAEVQTVTSVPVEKPSDHDDAMRVLTGLNRKFFKLGPLLAGGILSAVRERPDFVLAASCAHEGVVAYLLHETMRIPYAVMLHGSELARLPAAPIRRRVMARVLSSARLLIANSSFTRDLLGNLGLSGPTLVVNPPIDTAQVCTFENTDLVDRRYALQGKRVLLTTARLFPRKGHAQVIRTLGRLRDRYSTLVYVSTGNGIYRKVLEETAASCGVADRVTFTGFVNQVELSALYHRCEIYVSPGLYDNGDVEGFGISFLEAAAHGKPVIGGNIGGVRDAVVHGQTGLLIDATDDRAFESALVRLLDDEDLRARLGWAGSMRAKSTFTLAGQGAKLLNGLENALRPTDAR